jgi:hypothetical protein
MINHHIKGSEKRKKEKRVVNSHETMQMANDIYVISSRLEILPVQDPSASD